MLIQDHEQRSAFAFAFQLHCEQSAVIAGAAYLYWDNAAGDYEAALGPEDAAPFHELKRQALALLVHPN